jgi:hypothetical protein
MSGSHALTPATPAVHWDGPLRLTVASESRAHETYLVELDSFAGNGECVCEHFTCRLRPLLELRFTAAQAIEAAQVRLRPGQHPEDALRCKHIINARRVFCDRAISATAAAIKI